MRLFEFEAKQVLESLGISVPKGVIVQSPKEAAEAAELLGGPVVVKAQVLSGGRALKGGVVFADTPDQAQKKTKRLLDSELNGWPVKKVLIEKKVDINREFYLAVTIDPYGNNPILMASSQGGVNVEDFAAQNPDLFVIEPVDIFQGPGQYQVRNLLIAVGLKGKHLLAASDIVLKMYNVFSDYQASLVEINPLVLTARNTWIAVDAKINLDYNALQFIDMDLNSRERYQTEQEFQASQHGLSYVKLDGTIGLACTGAGLTLATLDLITAFGGKPANFLEFGGATYGNSYYALQIILSDPDVKVILINTFGLVARADVIAEGLVKAIQELKPEVPIVAAIRGTNEERARDLLWEKVGIESLDTTQEAVRKAVSISEGEV